MVYAGLSEMLTIKSRLNIELATYCPGSSSQSERYSSKWLFG